MESPLKKQNRNIQFDDDCWSIIKTFLVPTPPGGFLKCRWCQQPWGITVFADIQLVECTDLDNCIWYHPVPREDNEIPRFVYLNGITTVLCARCSSQAKEAWVYMDDEQYFSPQQFWKWCGDGTSKPYIKGTHIMKATLKPDSWERAKVLYKKIFNKTSYV